MIEKNLLLNGMHLFKCRLDLSEAFANHWDRTIIIMMEIAHHPEAAESKYRVMTPVSIHSDAVIFQTPV